MFTENLEAHVKAITDIIEALHNNELYLEAADTPNEADSVFNLSLYEKGLDEATEQIELALTTLVNSLIEEIIEEEDDPEAAYDLLEGLIIQLLRLTKI